MAILIFGSIIFGDESSNGLRSRNLLINSNMHSLTLASTVSDNTPNITFLTHGLGGGARDWSNDYGSVNGNLLFVEDPASLIEKMNNSIDSGINMYRIFVTDVN